MDIFDWLLSLSLALSKVVGVTAFCHSFLLQGSIPVYSPIPLRISVPFFALLMLTSKHPQLEWCSRSTSVHMSIVPVIPFARIIMNLESNPADFSRCVLNVEQRFLLENAEVRKANGPRLLYSLWTTKPLRAMNQPYTLNL